MKRTPLTRKTPLKRNKRLNPISQKKMQEKRDTNAERAAYVRRVWLCECCHKRPSTECHEMVGGGLRQLAVQERCCWLAVCRKCHDEIHHDHKAGWLLARQLACKKYADPKYYDRRRVLEIKGLAETAVTEGEVDSWM